MHSCHTSNVSGAQIQTHPTLSHNEICKSRNGISFQIFAATVIVEIAAFWVVTRVVLKTKVDKSEKHSAALSPYLSFTLQKATL